MVLSHVVGPTFGLPCLFTKRRSLAEGSAHFDGEDGRASVSKEAHRAANDIPPLESLVTGAERRFLW